MSGVFMYRKGEAKLFASPEEIPAGEGWQDTPVPDEAPEPTPEVAAVDAVDGTSEIDALREKAAVLGITIDGRWGVNKLKKVIEAHSEVNE